MARRHESCPSRVPARHAWRIAAALLPLLTSCGGGAHSASSATASTSAPAAPAPKAEAPAPKETAEASKKLPAECADPKAKLCVPPGDFAQRICGGTFQEATLALFGKGTPWARGYMTRTTDAWNASGGGMASSDKLAADEEVLILVHRAPEPGQMVVSGASGGYEVLRWNGACATLMAEEVTLRPPASPKYAKIVWKHLDDKVQEAMLGDTKISTFVSDHRKECKGMTTGEVSRPCAKAIDKLSKAIAEYVRSGGAVPEPSALP